MTKSEQKIAAILKKRGFVSIHTGWPDFLCINKKTGRCFGLEVKKGKDRLKPNQIIMHKHLNDCGLPVYVTYGRENLQRNGRKIFTEEVRSSLQKKINSIVAENKSLRERISELEYKMGGKYIRTPNGVAVKELKKDFAGYLDIEPDYNNVVDITKNIKFRGQE